MHPGGNKRRGTRLPVVLGVERPWIGERSSAVGAGIVARLDGLASMEKITDVHAQLTWIVNENAHLCDMVSQEYFHGRSLHGSDPDASGLES